jgi:hypothetical protein
MGPGVTGSDIVAPSYLSVTVKQGISVALGDRVAATRTSSRTLSSIDIDQNRADLRYVTLGLSGCCPGGKTSPRAGQEFLGEGGVIS